MKSMILHARAAHRIGLWVLLIGLIVLGAPATGFQMPAAQASPPLTGDANGIWTTVGSTGTVDESDMGIVSLSGALAELTAGAAAGSTLDIRYNVVAVDGLFTAPRYYSMGVRFRDNGTGARVVVRLKQFNFNTGATTTRMTLDSNSFGSAADYQLRSVAACAASWSFDFLNNAYFIEAQITKSATNGTPGLAAIRIGYTVC